MTQHQKQGGSLGGFIIVAVLLVLVLVGGLYGLQRYNSDRNGQTAKKDPQTSQETTKKDDSSKKESNDDTTTNRPAAIPGSASADGKSGTKEDDSTASGRGTAATEALPTTGPENVIFSMVAVGALTFAVASYVRSRSHHWTFKKN